MTFLRPSVVVSSWLSLAGLLFASAPLMAAGDSPTTRPSAPAARSGTHLDSLQNQLRQLVKKKAAQKKTDKAPTKQHPASRPVARTIQPKKSTAPKREGLKQELDRLRKRRALLKKLKKLWAKKPVKTRSTKRLLQDLGHYDWFEQNRVLRELVKRCPASKTAIEKTMKTSKDLRIRLLTNIAYRRCGGSWIKPLVDLLETYHDIPLPMTLGVLVEYGDKSVVPVLLKRIKTSKRPKQLLHALTFFPSARTAPVYARFLRDPDTTLRTMAREAVLRLPARLALPLLQKRLETTKKIKLRAALIRSLSRMDHPLTIPALLESLPKSNSSLRFLTKLSLKDKVELYQKRLGKKKVAKAPRSEKKAPWLKWWNIHRQTLLKSGISSSSTLLKGLKPSQFKKTALFYTTIHPMFGFGRMPALIYDASQPKPKSPYRGRIWYFGMKSKAYAALLKRVVDAGFFQWPQWTGNVRDMTLIYNGRSRKVSFGNARQLRFEALEEIITTFLRSRRFRLLFKDFFLRPDDATLTLEGKAGQWAYRSGDVLPKTKWSRTGKVAFRSDLESMFSSILELHQKLPSRVRLMSLDLAKHRLRLSMLMFGSRFLGRMAREALVKSHRFPGKPKMVGTAVRYLSADKIEQYIFDVPYRKIPARAHSKGRLIPAATAVSHAIIASGLRVTLLRLQTQKAGHTRIRLTARATGTPSLLRFLSKLAQQSTGDRLLSLRVNHSGEVDRATHPLIVQMAWEMGPTRQAAATVPFYLTLSNLRTHEMFKLVYK